MIEPGDLLIVDDDEDLRKQMNWGLGQDYQVHEAADRQQAVEVFQDVYPLVITLDLGLPPDEEGVEEGFAVLDSVLELNPRVKVIIITGRDEKAHALEAIGRGAYDFISKPVSLEDLHIILKRAFHVAPSGRGVSESATEGEPGGVPGDAGCKPPDDRCL